MKSKTFKIFSAIVFLIAIALITITVVPMIRAYDTPESFNAYIESQGPWGMVTMFFVQVSQVIVALIPGEVVEFLAGTLYGPIGGLLFCMIGVALGQFIVFVTVRFLGRDFAERVAGGKTVKKFSFLNDESKLRRVTFLLFFLPGTPKDLLTYLVPFTKLNLRDFMIITLIARIPSILSSTIAGSAFAKMDIPLLIITYGAIAAFSLVGVLIYKAWEKRKMNKSK